MSKIQQTILEVYENDIIDSIVEDFNSQDYDIDSMSEQELDEIVGTMAGYALGKALAPVATALGKSMMAKGTASWGLKHAMYMKGAGMVKGAKIAPYVSGAVGAVGDAVVGTVVGKALVKKAKDVISTLKGHKEFKVKWLDRNHNWQYRTTKAKTYSDAVDKVAKDNNISAKDIEPNKK